jgi:hypothetical protein
VSEPAPRSPEYLAGWIHERLAEDDRLNEQGLDVRVVGDSVIVSGVVATPERRAAVAGVVAELAPDRTLRNELAVASMEAPTGSETLA